MASAGKYFCSVVTFCLGVVLGMKVCTLTWGIIPENQTAGNVLASTPNTKKEVKNIMNDNSTTANVIPAVATNDGDDGKDGHAAIQRNVLRITIYEYLGNGPSKWMPRDALDHCSAAGEHRKCVFVEPNDSMPSDALLVNMHVMYPWITTPLPPRPVNLRQKWIMYSEESQRLTLHPRYLHVFHAAATIMPYGQIPVHLGEVSERTTPITRPQMNQTEWLQKNNVAWLVSSCNSPGGRDDYAKELAKYIDVAVYGGCGKKCNSEECWNMQRHFRFYLAFENSVCAGYVTEKLYRTLGSDMIPIVYGMYDYKHYLPENSFIDVRDFHSPKHLADYLHKVAKDKQLYESYFAWKDRYEAHGHYHDKTHLRNAACGICDYLHRTQNEELKTIDLDALWNTKSYCIPKEQFWKIVGLRHEP